MTPCAQILLFTLKYRSFFHDNIILEEQRSRTSFPDSPLCNEKTNVFIVLKVTSTLNLMTYFIDFGLLLGMHMSTFVDACVGMSLWMQRSEVNVEYPPQSDSLMIFHFR